MTATTITLAALLLLIAMATNGALRHVSALAGRPELARARRYANWSALIGLALLVVLIVQALR